MYLVKFPDFCNFSNFPHFPREIVQIFPLPAGNEKRGKCADLPVAPPPDSWAVPGQYDILASSDFAFKNSGICTMPA